VPHVSASRELLAPLDDVWAFVAEPYNLPNWWPRLGGVEPDRRGFAPGARWLVTGENRPSLLRRPEAVGHLLVMAVEPKRRFAFQLTGDRLDVELKLEAAGETRTLATLEIRGPWLVGLSRSLPNQALNRLHGLCQTAADL
jgi:uncharacterized protein YndB with AHSA1/START domain